MSQNNTLAVGAMLSALTLTPAAAQYFPSGWPPPRIDPQLHSLVLKPDLRWSDRSTYSIEGPLTNEFFVEGLGIDDFVTAFSAGVPFDIGQDLINHAGSFADERIGNPTHPEGLLRVPELETSRGKM